MLFRSAAQELGEMQVPDAETAEPSEEEYYRDINNVYALIGVEPIEMEFGYSLIPLVDEGSESLRVFLKMQGSQE